ncbi:uncharacterized protein LOC141696029 [Apium graveolens]|uniref:uncharacterized protein LOC141696029 n=1 Tax=Apium graveolens TaxID=4045 RepID=UPI003D7ADB09
MEKSFKLAEVTDEKRTKYASYYLKDEASYWWESTKTLQAEGEAISWKKFIELFMENYLPIYMQDQLEMRFVDLKQENMIVVEYEVKFLELARFVPEYVNTEAKKAKRFQQGLKHGFVVKWFFSRLGHMLLCYSGKPEMTCFKCGKVGHMARNCKEPVQKANILRIAGPPPSPA